MIVFGGLDTNFQRLGDVWALSLTDMTWSKVEPAGTGPSPRLYHSAIYDVARDRVIVFGGDPIDVTYENDVWSLWLSPVPRWEQITPNGALPSPRRGHSAIYEPNRDRMLVFGGDPLQSDLWALSFADTTWRLLNPIGQLPPPRYAHTVIYDPVEDRMVLFGGTNGNQFLNDVWQLSLMGADPSWSHLILTPPSPSARDLHSAIYDPDYRRMIVFGGAPDVTEPTWALSLGSPMRWSPERPMVEVAPSELTLPVVTIGDTVSVDFVISNGGLQPLAVQSIELPSPDVHVTLPGPLQLPWKADTSETVWLAATSPGVLNDSLVIVSNDPFTPRRRVNLRIEVRGLEFNTHVLGSPDSVAPGASFIVVVTPNSGVAIESGKLFYRVADGSSPFDSLTLTPLATDFIAAIPASAVTERGVDYYAKVENSGFVSTRPAGAPATYFTQDVSSADAITAVIPRPTSGSDFLAGQEIDVDVVLPDGAIFDSGTLHFRRGGETSYASLPLSPTGIPGQTSATIPDSLVGPRGLEFWVEVHTFRSTLRYPAGETPAVVRTKVPDLAETSVHPGGRYRLLTIPIDFGGDFSGSLDGLLTDQLGTYAPTRWRAFSYDPATDRNVEFSSADAARFRPQPGRAFWLISRGSHRVDTKPVAGLSTSTAGNYSIPLAAGWNLIGNPFDFPVAWADVLRDPGVEDPVAFNPSRGTIGDYDDVLVTVLMPFEGYFVHANQAATLNVRPREAPVPVEETPISTEQLLTRSASAPEAKGDWELRLFARAEESMDGSSSFGIRHGAVSGWDALDQRKPPAPPGPWIRAAFVHPEWGDRSGEYRLDLRAPGSEGETWEIEVRTHSPGQVVALDLDAVVPLPSHLEVRIIDREQGTLTPWPLSAPSATAAHQGTGLLQILSFGSRPYRLAIAVGTQSYLDRSALHILATPSRIVLDQNAPNPFRHATRLRFALPRAGQASLEVYSVLGERIASLLQATSLEPGYHTAVWDGRTSRGAQAPSGVYLLRLEVGNETLTRRIVLVR